MQNLKLHLTMKPLNIKLYDIARTKMNFNDEDAMKFVSSIHELNDHRFENLVTKEFFSEKMNGIDQRFTKLESKIDLRFITFESATNQRFIQNESNNDQRFSIFQSNIDQRFKDAESFISQKFTEIKASIDTKIAEAKSDLTKWMFIFWASQMTITLGILLLILNK
jgi:hypothetical protein